MSERGRKAVTIKHACRLLARASCAAAALAVGILPSAASAAEEPTRPQPTRPNVVVILLDDVGFSDMGSFGGEIPTTNIDALTKNRLAFTQFSNNARCRPSAGSLVRKRTVQGKGIAVRLNSS